MAAQEGPQNFDWPAVFRTYVEGYRLVVPGGRGQFTAEEKSALLSPTVQLSVLHMHLGGGDPIPLQGRAEGLGSHSLMREPVGS